MEEPMQAFLAGWIASAIHSDKGRKSMKIESIEPFCDDESAGVNVRFESGLVLQVEVVVHTPKRKMS